MQALGKHLLVELHGCSPELLKRTEMVKEILLSAAKVCKATVVDLAFHEFSPFGVSGVVVIAESHLSIHTWPEYRYAAVDIFTCGDAITPEEAADYIANRFKCKDPTIIHIKRGIIQTASGRTGKLSHKMPQGKASPSASSEAKDAHQELSLVY